jgi:hypothetical protein
MDGYLIRDRGVHERKDRVHAIFTGFSLTPYEIRAALLPLATLAFSDCFDEKHFALLFL